MAIAIGLLAVVWAMEKLYASHLILETDQKPPEATISKSLNQATPKIAADTDQNFCLSLYSKIYSWCYSQTCGEVCPDCQELVLKR